MMNIEHETDTLPPKSLPIPISVYVINMLVSQSWGRGKGRVNTFVSWGRF